MNIEHLREFSYLAETLSFNITAKHFFISTSVLSKHIAAMEADLGVRLFERDRHGVELTHEGREFYEGVACVLADYDHALARIAPERLRQRKTLRVGYLRNAVRPFLARFVAFFKDNYPTIDLEITCMEYRELLYEHRSHRVDVLLNMEVDPEAELACDNAYIYTDRIYAVVAKGNPLAARAEGITVDELAGSKLVLPDIAAYPGYVQRCEAIVREVDDIEVVCRYKDIDTFAFYLEEGGYVGFSSGHNARVLGEHLAFVPIRNLATNYDVTARWLRVTDPELIEATKAAAAACATYMAHWDDGVSCK